MASITTLVDAIARSVKRDEITHVHLSDLLVGLRHEAEQARDFGCVEDIDNLTGEMLANATTLARVVRSLIDAVVADDPDTKDFDDVENGDVWELWGRTDNHGDSWESYRVHIHLNR